MLASCRNHDLRGWLCRKLSSKIIRVVHKGVDIAFYAPSGLTRYRAKSFSVKEPDTLAWIEAFRPSAVFWDIGANVGIYSVYAAKRGAKVFAFEPSVFNLELLAKNIELNQLTGTTTIIPLPLTDKTGLSRFRMTDPCQGSALSTFRESYGADGLALRENFSYQTYGISIEDFFEQFNPGQPDYVKLDVDGIEHLILKGGIGVLAHVKEILVEISPGFDEQKKECYQVLGDLGFRVKSSSGEINSTANVIWTRE